MKKGKQFNIACNKTNLEKNKAKIEINKTLGKLSENINKSMAIVLDGRSMKTTKALINAGWKSSKIVVPNNSDDYFTIKKKHWRTHFTTLYKLLKKHYKSNNYKPIDLIYMDYMCTLEFNRYINPMSI